MGAKKAASAQRHSGLPYFRCRTSLVLVLKSIAQALHTEPPACSLAGWRTPCASCRCLAHAAVVARVAPQS
eukprot:2338261-Heterocapsa_arctica.AAC.1